MSENSGINTVTNVQSETDPCDSSSTACTQKPGNGKSYEIFSNKLFAYNYFFIFLAVYLRENLKYF